MSSQRSSPHLVHRPALRVRRGFTLVELISTMSILAAVCSSTAFILFTAINGYVSGYTQAELYRSGSAALERITREIRTIAPDGVGDPSPAIDSMSESHIEWESGSRVELISTSLWFDAGEGPRLLLQDVQSFTLTAFDADRDVVTLPVTGDDCDPIRRIQIEVSLQDQGVTASLRTLVHLRTTMQ